MLQRLKILYLDDEASNLIGFKATFRLRFNVYTAQNTAEAVNYLIQYPDIRIIFCDQRMPGKSGVEFFEEIRTLFPLPVRIMITAYADINAVIDAINKGNVYRYVRKPWREEEILKVVEEADKYYNTNSLLSVRNEELTSAYRELDKFAYSVSHDIRGPMAGILTAIDFIKELKDVDEIRNVLDMMEKSVHKLDEFIITMHEYYNMQKGELVVGNIDFNKLVNDQRDIYDIYANANQITFTSEVEQQEEFRNDLTSLKLIMNNLLSNAFKYQRKTEINKMVHLRIRVSNGLATIVVQDNGIGIEEKSLSEIFRLYFRGNNTEAGFGFGLYNLKGALMKLNGQIDVDSKIGAGTTFRVTLPSL